nr:MAG TPA: hypothetical protein [Caudoviricetes sp.]
MLFRLSLSSLLCSSLFCWLYEHNTSLKRLCQ